MVDSRYSPILLGIAALLFAAPVIATAGAALPATPAGPVSSEAAMQRRLATVPATRDFPADLGLTLRAEASATVVEMSTQADCLPCADAWAKLMTLHRRYGLHIALLDRDEALLRSGRLGLPWLGHPMLWVRPVDAPTRTIPIAIGTDRIENLTRNLYLAVKMLGGVRPAVAVRGMARFTGIVGAPPAPPGATAR